MISEVLRIAALVGFVWSCVVASVSIEALRRLAARRRRDRRLRGSTGGSALAGHHAEPVLILRPCAGAEPLLERTLTSLVYARRSFPVRCCFAVADEADAALPVALRVCAVLQAAGIDSAVLITGAGGPNRKASQLAVALDREGTSASALIVADSDVDLRGADLDALIEPLFSAVAASVSASAPVPAPAPAPVPASAPTLTSFSAGRLDAVWAPPVESAAPCSLGDRASAAVLGGSLHAFPLLAALDGGGLVGKLFSIRLDALRAIGGFGSLTEILGEDVEIARRLKALGGAIGVAPFAARSLASGRTWEQVVARYARWLVMIRAQRPWLLPSYPALFFAAPLVGVLAAITAPFAPAVSLASAGVAVTARLLVARGAAVAAGRPVALVSLVTDALLADLVLAAAFASALRTRTIVWRSRVLTVDRSGALRETAA